MAAEVERIADEAAAWVECQDRCDDPSMHAHFTSRPFRWWLPRFNVYVPADQRPRVGLNRYPHNIIGVWLVLFRRCWGVRWKGGRR